MSGVDVRRERLSPLTPRARPIYGLRPTVRFLLAFTGMALWVAFSIVASRPWRSELADAIGPVMAWVIPILMAYIPALVIGFLCFTLLLTRYQPPSPHPPVGPWPPGEWPAVTVLVAAFNEEAAIEATLERL